MTIDQLRKAYPFIHYGSEYDMWKKNTKWYKWLLDRIMSERPAHDTDHAVGQGAVEPGNDCAPAGCRTGERGVGSFLVNGAVKFEFDPELGIDKIKAQKSR